MIMILILCVFLISLVIICLLLAVSLVLSAVSLISPDNCREVLFYELCMVDNERFDSIIKIKNHVDIKGKFSVPNECLICFDVKPNLKFLPCKHKIVCNSCYVNRNFKRSMLRQCFLCRSSINALIVFQEKHAVFKKYKE
jgi:hypothetical protein